MLSDKDFEKKYNRFAMPAFKVNINGQNIETTILNIEDLTVNLSVEREADIFSFRVGIVDSISGEFYTQWIDRFFKLGSEVEISMGYEKNLKLMMSGIITSIDFSLTESEAGVTVHGMDNSYKLMKDSGKSKDWSGKSISDIVSNVVRENGFDLECDTTDDIMSTQNGKLSIFQKEESDFEFITRLAKSCGFEFYMKEKKAFFKKKKTKSSEYIIKYKETLYNLSINKKLAGVYSKVTVSGMKAKEKISVSVCANDVGLADISDDMNKLVHSENIVYDERVNSENDARKKAEIILKESAMEFLTGNCETVGIPDIVPGTFFKIEGVSEEFNKQFYANKVTHAFNDQGYTTKIEFRGT